MGILLGYSVLKTILLDDEFTVFVGQIKNTHISESILNRFQKEGPLNGFYFLEVLLRFRPTSLR